MFKTEDISIDKFYYNPLFRDYIFNFPRLQKYFQYDYRKIEDYRERKEDITSGFDRSKQRIIASILKSYNLKLKCSKETIENIDKIQDSNALIIIGGQQPGLITGPIYIIYKILTVIKLSKFLEKELKVPIVPVFWNASDDDKIKHVEGLNLPGSEIKNIKLDLSGVREKTRFSGIYLEAERFKRLASDIGNSLDPSVHKQDIMDFVNNSLDITINNFSSQKGKANISSFFSVIISRMFSKYGLVVIDPAEKSLKELSLDILEYDMKNYDRINKLITTVGQSLEKENYHAQLKPSPGALDFFFDDGGIRKKIFAGEDDDFLFNGTHIKKNGLLQKIKKEIDGISLNVILRPLFEDSILPVLSIVCGPGEVSYFSQLKPVYDDAGLKLPIIYPRLSATVIDKKTAGIMEKTGLGASDIGEGKELALKKMVGNSMGIDLGSLIRKLDDKILLDLEEMESMLSGEGMNVSNSFDRIKRNIKKETKVLSKKLNSEFKRQHEYLENGLDRLFAGILPGGNLQEREVNILHYLNKYGFGFLESIYSGFKPLDFSHKFFRVD